MKFYNSQSKQLEDFPKKEEISIYSCGPTVYDCAHIGNLRTFLFEDLLIRTLKADGFKVSHTRNITDVDDKTIHGAIAQNKSLKEFTDVYRTAFLKDLTDLHFDQNNTNYLNATDYIQEMIQLIQDLVDKGFAYQKAEGVYFKSKEFNNYGDFAGLDLTNIQDGASGSDIDFDKDDIGDFVIWKGHKDSDGDVYWDSPWGKGRPGWHTECAAMVRVKYPEGLDIHTGGIDLLFPHHTNEKAHYECLSNKSMAKFWLHATHLLVDNKKMSKSLGNFYTVNDLLQQNFTHEGIRFYLQTGAHYRSPLNFTLQGLKGAESALNRINNFIFELSNNPQIGAEYPLYEKFNNYLHEDLNISGAIGEIFTVISDYYNGSKLSSAYLLEEFKKVNQILAVLNFSQDKQEQILDEITQELFNKRVQARENKDWALSDLLRDQLLEHGIEVRDSKEGTVIRKI